MEHKKNIDCRADSAETVELDGREAVLFGGIARLDPIRKLCLSMNPLAIQKAITRLGTAKRALADLPNCKDYDTFIGVWYTFLTSAKGIYTVLEQGAKASPQSRQWFGSKSAERRRDPLLQYLYQARDDDEHGLEPVTRKNPGSLAIGVAKEGFSQSMTVNMEMRNGKGWIETTSHDGKPVLIENTPPHPELIAVHGRGNMTYDVPNEHLGATLASNLPAAVAEVAVRYFERLISEAQQLA